MGSDGCGARVPCLIWVLEPVGFGDVMMDGGCPATGVQPLVLSRATGAEAGVTWGCGSWLHGIRMNAGLGAPSHRSGDGLPGGVAEAPQNVVDPARQFAGHRQVGPLGTDTLPDVEIATPRRCAVGEEAEAR